MTGILSNIMEISLKNFHNGHEGHDNLGSHMVGHPTLRLENFNLTLPNAL